MLNEKTSCKECEYVKCYAVSRQMYYCDHENRIDDMGKLGLIFCQRKALYGVQREISVTTLVTNKTPDI